MEFVDDELVGKIGECLRAQNKMLTVAESCTGGWVAQALTSVSGSSDWFDRGFVTYSNVSKQEMLGVRPETIDSFGTVSENTAREMAEGALAHSRAQVSLAITGIAGPTGGSAYKPFGTVWFAWAAEGQDTLTECKHLIGERNDVRSQAVVYALQQLLGFINR